MTPVIIPAYKNPAQLAKCIAALDAQTLAASPIMVHDNSENNIGFTAACNAKLRECLAVDAKHNVYDYAILLNQDCYLKPDAIEKAIAFMEDTPKCAIAGMKQLLAEDPNKIVHGGCLEAFPNGRHIGGYVSKGDCNQSAKMPWVNGAVMVVRLAAVREFGLMDEGMFLVGSDSDWCYTAWMRGWEVWYCADAVCLHEGGVTTKPMTGKVAEWSRKDMNHWRMKWIGSEWHARIVSMNIQKQLEAA
jgi:GT2 family glycosyltransferase